MRENIVAPLALTDVSESAGTTFPRLALTRGILTRGVIKPQSRPGVSNPGNYPLVRVIYLGSYRGVPRGGGLTGHTAGLGRAGPHDLVLALAHLYVFKSSTGRVRRPSARPEGSFSLITLNRDWFLV